MRFADVFRFHAVILFAAAQQENVNKRPELTGDTQ
jgi:hypothetical protein